MTFQKRVRASRVLKCDQGLVIIKSTFSSHTMLLRCCVQFISFFSCRITIQCRVGKQHFLLMLLLRYDVKYRLILSYLIFPMHRKSIHPLYIFHDMNCRITTKNFTSWRKLYPLHTTKGNNALTTQHVSAVKMALGLMNREVLPASASHVNYYCRCFEQKYHN